MKKNGSSAEIKWVNVDSNYQRRGIGRELMAFLQEIARARDVNRVWLSSRKSSENFYKNIGYVAVGDYYDTEPTGAHIIMEITL